MIPNAMLKYYNMETRKKKTIYQNISMEFKGYKQECTKEINFSEQIVLSKLINVNERIQEPNTRKKE